MHSLSTQQKRQRHNGASNFGISMPQRILATQKKKQKNAASNRLYVCAFIEFMNAGDDLLVTVRCGAKS